MTKPTNNTPVLHRYDMGPEVTAFSTTRMGGYGHGAYGGMNINRWCGDDPKTIIRNMAALGNVLWPERHSVSIASGHREHRKRRIVFPHQTHRTRVALVDEKLLATDAAERDKALDDTDALMTGVEDVCIGVSTADCIPVLLYDSEHRAACAVHAGWRGTVARIAEKAVRAMTNTFGTDPAQLKAVIGPGISCDAFEVGDEVYEAFADAGFRMEAISRRKDKWHIDLWECNRLQLTDAGVQPDSITVDGTCTYANHDKFFSARRLGTASGRIFTGIIVRGADRDKR